MDRFQSDPEKYLFYMKYMDRSRNESSGRLRAFERLLVG